MDLTQADKDNLKVFIQQEPFRLFKKVLDGYIVSVTDQMVLSARSENIQIYQGILKGLKGATNVLTTGATDKFFGLAPLALADAMAKEKSELIDRHKPPRSAAAKKS